MSIDLLEQAAAALKGFLDEVVFVGGATIVLWITDPGAPSPRPTKDVDVIVEVTSLLAYEDFQRRLRAAGFSEDQESGIICRWDGPGGLVLDAMPAAPHLAGFVTRWQSASLPHAVTHRLPSRAKIRAVPAPYLLGTKFEAFDARGKGDYVGSRDFADIVALADGRAELHDELAAAEPELRAYVAERLESHLRADGFLDGVFAALSPDAASQARAEEIVLPRLDALVSVRP